MTAERSINHENLPGKDHPGLVVATAIFRDGKVLLAQRALGVSMGGGKWEFPGGKIEFGEFAPQALAREIDEELGVKIRSASFPFAISEIIQINKTDNSVEAHWFVPMYESLIEEGEPQIQEPDKCADIRWVAMKDIKYEELTHATKEGMAVLERKYPHGFPKFR